MYGLNNKNVLVIESLGIYDIPTPNYILLRESLNLNLERLIKTLNHKLIIADVFNYKSHVLQLGKHVKFTILNSTIPLKTEYL